MPSEYDVRVTPSLLDRLLDLDPKSSSDAPTTRAESVRELRRAVQRDLESLLNSRDPHPDLVPAFTEVRQSVLTYGLPDFTQVASADLLKQQIQDAIRRFEPRLAAPTVTVLQTPGQSGTWSLRIDARLIMDPAPEPISFDIVMPTQTMRTDVKESS